MRRRRSRGVASEAAREAPRRSRIRKMERVDGVGFTGTTLLIESRNGKNRHGSADHRPGETPRSPAGPGDTRNAFAIQSGPLGERCGPPTPAIRYESMPIRYLFDNPGIGRAMKTHDPNRKPWQINEIRGSLLSIPNRPVFWMFPFHSAPQVNRKTTPARPACRRVGLRLPVPTPASGVGSTASRRPDRPVLCREGHTLQRLRGRRHAVRAQGDYTRGLKNSSRRQGSTIDAHGFPEPVTATAAVRSSYVRCLQFHLRALVSLRGALHPHAPRQDLSLIHI